MRTGTCHRSGQSTRMGAPPGQAQSEHGSARCNCINKRTDIVKTGCGPTPIVKYQHPRKVSWTYPILLEGVRDSLLVAVRPPAVLGFTSSTAPAAGALAKAANEEMYVKIVFLDIEIT